MTSNSLSTCTKSGPSPLSSPNGKLTVASPKRGQKREEGWKEVVRRWVLVSLIVFLSFSICCISNWNMDYYLTIKFLQVFQRLQTGGPSPNLTNRDDLHHILDDKNTQQHMLIFLKIGSFLHKKMTVIYLILIGSGIW